MFGNFFQDKVAKIQNTLDSINVQAPPSPDCPSVVSQLDIFPAVTEEVVRRFIMRSPNKSCILDPMPTWLLRDDQVLNAVLPHITDIVNASFAAGAIPKCLKTAVVIPLIKKAGIDPNNLKNYRPVSNLPFVSKLIERIVCANLLDHFSRNNLEDPLQSAYRKGHSTESALLKVKGDIDMALDRGEGTVLLLLDLSAAFDTVDHRILLGRLSDMGISGLAHAWLKDYLSCRAQVIDTGTSRSSEFDLSTGVPQGSVLGPILFLSYVQPLAEVLNLHLRTRMGYADDTQLYTHFKVRDASSLHCAIERLEHCAKDVRSWMIKNKLMLNDSKTELLVVAPSNCMQSVLACKPCVKVGDAIILPSEAVRDLGAVLDKHMSMAPQVSQVCKSAYYHLRCISKVRKHLTKDACAKAVNSLVTSRLDFCNGLLIGVPNTLLTRLQVAQNSAARLVAGVRKREHITPILRSLHWLPIQQRILYKVLLMTYKVVNNLSPPEYLVSLLQPYTPARSLRSEQKDLLKVPSVKRKAGERSFHYTAPFMWNSIDLAIRSSATVDAFKRNLKTFLFKSLD